MPPDPLSYGMSDVPPPPLLKSWICPCYYYYYNVYLLKTIDHDYGTQIQPHPYHLSMDSLTFT